VVALGGGGGGAGRTTLVAELGRYAQQRRNRSVVWVDADSDHEALWLRANLRDTEPAPGASAALGFALWEEDAEPDRRRPALAVPFRDARGRLRPPMPAEAVLARLRSLPADLVVIDLGAHLDPWTLRLFVGADVPVTLTCAEPTSIHAATRWMQEALFAGLLADPSVDPAAAAQLRQRLPQAWALAQLATTADELGLGPALTRVQERLDTYLVMSQCRESAEREVGHSIALAWWYLMGLRPRYAGAVDHDPRRWFHIRQGQLHPPLGSESGTGVQLEELAKRLLEPSLIDAEQPRHRTPDTPACMHLLGAPLEAPAPEIRQVYRRLWEGVRRDHVGVQQLLHPALRERLLQDLEAAQRELNPWLAERPSPQAAAQARRPVPEEGTTLRQVRVQQGISEREMSLQTRIGLKVLKAIEEFDVEELPRTIYLRQYLLEIARVLELQPEQVVDPYLTRVAEHQRQRLLKRTTRTTQG
jgi:MinD-like ATPase involved in chromosome partitioning or flagellar assembly